MKPNMYSDSVKQWNVFVGCKFDCVYCKKSFQAQMKRQKHNCIKCYNYEPHFHLERLNQSLPNTEGDEFIWACSSGDIFFAKKKWMERILERIRELSHKTFFFQTKDPSIFHKYIFPKNVILGITLESDIFYPTLSKAPSPYRRIEDFSNLNYPYKIVTIEPILEFNLSIFIGHLKRIRPNRVYIGYDTKKNNLPEPKLTKTLKLCKALSNFTKVKPKLMRERNDRESM